MAVGGRCTVTRRPKYHGAWWGVSGEGRGANHECGEHQSCWVTFGDDGDVALEGSLVLRAVPGVVNRKAAERRVVLDAGNVEGIDP